jgi:transposase
MAKGQPFAPEVRQEAVRLYRVSGRPFRAGGGSRRGARVAAALGACRPRSRRARRGGVPSDEREKLRRLRRENARLREERDILKKPTTFFARETDQRR